MVPTPRLVRFLTFGSALWLLWLAFPAGWLAGAAYLLLLGALCIAEYRALPSASAFEFDRDFGRFALGSLTDVRVTVRNTSKRFVELNARDELPAGLEQAAPIPELHLAGKTECEFVYQVRPMRRGRYQLKTMAVRIRGRRALIEKQVRIPVPAEVRVYPR